MCLFDYNLARLKRSRLSPGVTCATGSATRIVRADANRTGLRVWVQPPADMILGQNVMIFAGTDQDRPVGILTATSPELLLSRDVDGDVVGATLYAQPTVTDEVSVYVRETYLDIDPSVK